MITFEQFYYLEEARRNPEMNKKENVVERLKEYSTNPNMFLTFSDDFRRIASLDYISDEDDDDYRDKSLSNTTKSSIGSYIGINPKATSANMTPQGVYVYPMKETVDRFLKDPDDLNFSHRSYIYILECNRSNLLDLTTVDESLYKKYVDMFNKYLEQYITDKKSMLMIEQGLTTFHDMHSSGYGRNLLDYSLYISILKSNASVINKKGLTRKTFAQFTNFGSDFSISSWTKTLLHVDIKGLIDLSDDGIIHGAEPIQAVFLTPEIYDVVDMFINPFEDVNHTISY